MAFNIYKRYLACIFPLNDVFLPTWECDPLVPYRPLRKCFSLPMKPALVDRSVPQCISVAHAAYGNGSTVWDKTWPPLLLRATTQNPGSQDFSCTSELRSKYVFPWLRFWMGSPDDVVAVCNARTATQKSFPLMLHPQLVRFWGKCWPCWQVSWKNAFVKRKDTVAHLVS